MRGQSFLSGEHIAEILAAYRDCQNIDGFSRDMDWDTLLSRGADLAISRIVGAPSSGGPSHGEVPLRQALEEWDVRTGDKTRRVTQLITKLKGGE